MANSFYNASGWPTTRAPGASAPARSEFASIAAGFDKMPTLAGNALKYLRVNAGGTALEATNQIDAVTIGGVTPGAGTFTTLSVTSGLSMSSDITLDNNHFLAIKSSGGVAQGMSLVDASNIAKIAYGANITAVQIGAGAANTAVAVYTGGVSRGSFASGGLTLDGALFTGSGGVAGSIVIPYGFIYYSKDNVGNQQQLLQIDTNTEVSHGKGGNLTKHKFFTAGTQRAQIDALGNFMLGTSDPTNAWPIALSHSNEAGASLITIINSNVAGGTTRQFYVAHSGAHVQIGNYRSGNVQIMTGANQSAVFTNTYQLGVGNSYNPTAGVQFSVLNGTTGLYQYFATVMGDGPAVGGLGSGIQFGWGGDNKGPRIQVVHGGDSNNAGIAFSTLSASAHYERMRIHPAGYITIGSPTFTGAPFEITNPWVAGVLVSFHGGNTGMPLRLVTGSAAPWAMDLYRSDLGFSTKVYNDGVSWAFQHTPSVQGSGIYHYSNVLANGIYADGSMTYFVHASGYPRHYLSKYIGITQDASSGYYDYIPLVPYITGVTNDAAICIGTFTFQRGDGGSYNHIQTVHVSAQRAYDGVRATLHSDDTFPTTGSNPLPFRLYIATIAGKQWLCISTGSLVSSMKVSFTGIFGYGSVTDGSQLLQIVSSASASGVSQYYAVTDSVGSPLYIEDRGNWGTNPLRIRNNLYIGSASSAYGAITGDVGSGFSYGTFRIAGTKGGYCGIVFDDGGDVAAMFDTSGNGGFYREGTGVWSTYWNQANLCLGIGTSTTDSNYSIYAPKGARLGGYITADGHILQTSSSGSNSYFRFYRSTTVNGPYIEWLWYNDIRIGYMGYGSVAPTGGGDNGVINLVTGTLASNCSLSHTGNILSYSSQWSTFNGYTPTNGVMRMTPNFHLNTPVGYGLIVNWDNGSGGGGNYSFRVGDGVSASNFTVAANGYVDITKGAGYLTIGGYSARGESSEIAVAGGSNLYSWAHGHGRPPDGFQVFLRCKTAEANFSVGDEVEFAQDVGATTRSVHWFANSTYCYCDYYTTATTPVVRDLVTHGQVAITAANWKVVFRGIWL